MAVTVPATVSPGWHSLDDEGVSGAALAGVTRPGPLPGVPIGAHTQTPAPPALNNQPPPATGRERLALTAVTRPVEGQGRPG